MLTAIIGLFSGRTIRNQVILDVLKRQQENERALTAALRQLGEEKKKSAELERRVGALEFNAKMFDPDNLRRHSA